MHAHREGNRVRAGRANRWKTYLIHKSISPHEFSFPMHNSQFELPLCVCVCVWGGGGGGGGMCVHVGVCGCVGVCSIRWARPIIHD